MRGFLIFLMVFWGATGAASEFRILGRASLFNNDYLGDGDDRWRTGSYSRSTFFGTEWLGEMPQGGVYELRFRGEVIAPTDASQPPQSGERPFVGVAAMGMARHTRMGRFDVSAGGEIVVIGPQTGVSSFVTEAHDLLGFKPPRAAAGELANDLIPTGFVEASRLIARSASRPFELRPFLQAQLGAETYARIGMDAFVGRGVQGDLLTRDVVTGHVMTVTSLQTVASWTPMFGADIAHVFDSTYLPGSSGLAPKPWRMRVRGGLRSLGQSRDVFVGLTWLSPEYEGQPNGQVLGSLSVDHHF